MNSKIYWITGASTGIGKELALELAKQGNKVIISARNESKLRQVSDNYPNIKVLPFDLENFEATKCVQAAIECFGRVDVLVNNAGLSQRALVKDIKIEVVEKIMQINFLGTVKLSLAMLPHFLTQGSGQFVITSSLVGKFGTPLRSVYSASKHALHGFFDSLRAELNKDNISVTIVCPGFVKTDVSINAMTADGKKQGSMDSAQDKAMEPNIFAKKMVMGINSNKNEIYIGGKEIIGVYIKRFFPSLFAKIIAKAKVT
jgi:dehydrogenase/reductase SDR family member 7B